MNTVHTTDNLLNAEFFADQLTICGIEAPTTDVYFNHYRELVGNSYRHWLTMSSGCRDAKLFISHNNWEAYAASEKLAGNGIAEEERAELESALEYIVGRIFDNYSDKIEEFIHPE